MASRNRRPASVSTTPAAWRNRSATAGLHAGEIAAACRRADDGRAGCAQAIDSGAHRLRRRARRRGRRRGLRGARAAAWPRLADTLVVDGIGGSALGALALETAFRPRRRLAVLDNVDPEGVAAKLSGLDPSAPPST